MNFLKKIFFKKGGINMNFLNFIPLYIPKNTIKWMIIFVGVITIVNLIVITIKNHKKK